MARSSASPKASTADALGGLALHPANQAARQVMIADPDGAAAESVRALRTRIQSQHLRAGRRALAICGPTPEVGCTFIAVNLAIALSQVGIKTLLVDADLRDPSIQTYFDPPLIGMGLYECLGSALAPVAECTHENVLPNLDVLTAGQPDAAGHELISGDRFSEVIDVCVRDYDMTIVDTPPANACADGLRVSTVTGFSLIVTRKNRTLVSDVRVLIDQLNKERAQAVGTVLNSF